MTDLDRDEISLLLELKGSLDAPGEREVRARIDEVRAAWRTS